MHKVKSNIPTTINPHGLSYKNVNYYIIENGSERLIKTVEQRKNCYITFDDEIKTYSLLWSKKNDGSEPLFKSKDSDDNLHDNLILTNDQNLYFFNNNSLVINEPTFINDSSTSMTIGYQNKAYGYMKGHTSVDVYYTQIKLSEVFNTENNLGSSLQRTYRKSDGYHIDKDVFGGIGGLALLNISPKNDILITKIQIQTGVATYVTKGPLSYINGTNWAYSDDYLSKNGVYYYDNNRDKYIELAMNCNNDKYLYEGWYYYNRGGYLNIIMTIEDEDETKEFTKTQRSNNALVGWSSQMNIDNNTFDFTDDIAKANLTKNAKTINIKFQQSSNGSVWYAMMVNTCLLFKN